jgi:hypothetical protein
MGKAILPISPQFLIEFLGIGKFNVLRTQYNWERDRIEFVIEHDIFPETEPGIFLPTVQPYYEITGECQVKLKEIRMWVDGKVIKYEDIEQFKSEKAEA